MGVLNYIWLFLTKWIDYIIYTISIILTYLQLDQKNFFIKLVTVDSIYSALFFIRNYLNKNLTESQIVEVSQSLYKVSVLDRYIYYLLSYISYVLFCGFFWMDDNIFIKYLMLISTVPPVLNHILKTKVFMKITVKKENFVKLLISKQASFLIKLYSNAYLSKKIEIKHKEIYTSIGSYDDVMNYVSGVLKSTIVIILILYVKKASTSFYYGLLKYIYNYKSGDILSSITIVSAQKIIIEILENRRWADLLKPSVQNAIILLFQNRDEDANIIKIFMHEFNYRLIRMFSIWSLSSLFNNYILGPIGTVLLVLYRINKTKEGFIKIKNNKSMYVLTRAAIHGDEEGLSFYKKCYTIYRYSFIEIFFSLSSLLVGYLTRNYFLVAFTSQFAYPLIVNRFVYKIINSIYDETIKSINKLYKRNKSYNLIFISNFLYSLLIGYILDLKSFAFVLFGFGYNSISNPDIYRDAMLISLVLSSALSGFNILHMIHNSLVVYLILGMINGNFVYDNIYLKSVILDNFNDLKRMIYKKELRKNLVNKNEISDNIFKLSEDMFIEAISIHEKDNDNNDNNRGNINETQTVTYEHSEYKVTNNVSNIKIMENFCD